MKNLNIYKALAAFQNECPLIKKDRNNDFAKFKFVDLTDVVLAIKPILHKHGLAFFQTTEQTDQGTILSTTVFHVETGEDITATMALPTDVELKGMNRYQVIGSAISYIRKYQLTSLLGIVSDEKSIDELKPEKKKPKLSDEQFEKALVAIENGKFTKEKLESNYELTENQQIQL